MNKTRADKYLWCVRIYKTRTLATEACKGGNVKINGENIKPSRILNIGDEIQLKKVRRVYIYKIIQLLEKRVSASIARQYIEDISPVAEPDDFYTTQLIQYGTREKGSGRPTKKERRDIDGYNIER